LFRSTGERRRHGSRPSRRTYLLFNAIKFTPVGGSAHLRVRRVDSLVEIVVTDTWQGIPADFLPSVLHGKPEAPHLAVGLRRPRSPHPDQDFRVSFGTGAGTVNALMLELLWSAPRPCSACASLRR
jgi:hypothetical protein